jgi:hypothetical protein
MACEEIKYRGVRKENKQIAFLTLLTLISTSFLYVSLHDFDGGKSSTLQQTKFHEDVAREIQALLLDNESAIMEWNMNGFESFLGLFPHDDVTSTGTTTDPSWEESIWSSNQKKLFVHTTSGLCPISKQFKRSGSVKRHILIANLNENWGALSTPILNRTVDWGDLEKHWKRDGCDKDDIMEYLDHDRTLAVFTTQHQFMDHPKVHSIPLGVKNRGLILRHLSKNQVTRTELLMVNANGSDNRNNQVESVLKSFHDAGYSSLKNTYKAGGGAHIDPLENYYDQMRRSKVIMCPSGMGWDTYRLWEALYLGTIPVVEKYNRQDGWHRTLDDLPIIWVNTFEDMSPKFLEKEYRKIVRRGSESFNFEKLTIQFWQDFVESFLPGDFLTSSSNDQQTGGQPSTTTTTTTGTPNSNSRNPGGLATADKQKKFDDLKNKNLSQEIQALKNSEDEHSNHDATFFRTLLSNHPKRLNVCNSLKLEFNETQMTGKIDHSNFQIFDHTSKIAYGPKITKIGSSSSATTSMLQKILNVTDTENESIRSSLNSLENYAFFAFVRHPMSRFLAGFHQIEVFWRMNWISGLIDEKGLQWWNKFCISTPSGGYLEKDDKHLCTGSDPQSDGVTRLGRLSAFLDDIDRVGYFDQHIMPISYQLSISALSTELSLELHPRYFDIESMDDLSDVIATAIMGHPLEDSDKTHQMSRPKKAGDNEKMPWVISWSELTIIASSTVGGEEDIVETRKEQQLLAQTIIKKMCRLYENDVECLPYDIPQCSLAYY